MGIAVDCDFDGHEDSRDVRCARLQHVELSSCGRCAGTFAGVKPKCTNSAGAGADSPKRVDADRRAPEAHVLPPAVGYARLDRDARQPGGSTLPMRSWRSNTWCTASRRRAPRRPALPAVLRHAARAAPRSRSRGGLRFVAAVVSGQHVAAAAIPAICARVRCTNGRFWRDSSSAPGRRLRSIAQAQATAVSTVSHGRQTSSFGMSRSAAACSTDWCVGPSSPRPIESCVKT